tara:strand:+ start:180 stop:401 length:222 start_codon:yes stop_codon:yes gene_type:complete
MAFKMNKPDMSISYTKHSKGASPLNKVSAKGKASPPSLPSPQQDKQNKKKKPEAKLNFIEKQQEKNKDKKLYG